MTCADRIRADPSALVGEPALALHQVLDEVEEELDRHPRPPFVEVPSDRAIFVIGDSHGDWPAVSAALKFARARTPPGRFVALGDYIHRATREQPDPVALPSGSVWNAAYLLAWMAHDPDGIVLLRGNHEASRQIPVPGPTLLRELRRAYPRPEALALWRRLMDLLERLPLAARTANGVFLAHGGLPPSGKFDPEQWDARDLGLLEGLLWSDPIVDYEDRAVGFAYGSTDLEEFLRKIECRAMVKGHAPGHSGRVIFGGRLLTIHTSDLFARWGEGGIVMAEIPEARSIRDATEIRLWAWDGTSWNRRELVVVADDPSTDRAAPTDPVPSGSPGASRS